MSINRYFPKSSISVIAVLQIVALYANSTPYTFGFTLYPTVTQIGRIGTIESLNHKKRLSKISIYALTDRQLQFWEDCEDGLKDIENFYLSKGQDLDRIYEFGKR